MADSKRGGRSNENDDEFDENDVLDELDDSDDDADLDAEDDDASARTTARDRSSAVMARSGRSATSRSASKTKDRAASERGLFGRIAKFIREVVAELQKVIYPTRKELLTYTTVVLVFVVVVMTIVSLLDVGFAKLMFLVFGEQTTT